MIRFTYITHTSIPAPFVYLSVRCPQTGKLVADVPAQIDTAADRTILPGRLVKALELAQMGHISLTGFGGRVADCPTFSVEVAVQTLRPAAVKAASSDGENYVLLGRDVLNQFRLLLDGPGLALEIG